MIILMARKKAPDNPQAQPACPPQDFLISNYQVFPLEDYQPQILVRTISLRDQLLTQPVQILDRLAENMMRSDPKDDYLFTLALPPLLQSNQVHENRSQVGSTSGQKSINFQRSYCKKWIRQLHQQIVRMDPQNPELAHLSYLKENRIKSQAEVFIHAVRLRFQYQPCIWQYSYHFIENKLQLTQNEQELDPQKRSKMNQATKNISTFLKQLDTTETMEDLRRVFELVLGRSQAANTCKLYLLSKGNRERHRHLTRNSD